LVKKSVFGEVKKASANTIQKVPNVYKITLCKPILIKLHGWATRALPNPTTLGTSTRPSRTDEQALGMHEPGEGFRGHDGADGSFNWFDMPGNGELTRAALIGQMDWFYNLNQNAPFLMAEAAPSFSNKVLVDAGRESGYRFLNYANGGIFKLTLDYAEKAQPAIIQIITWNDYEEGTIIEPTIERGYAELEVLQDFRKKYDGGFAFPDKPDVPNDDSEIPGEDPAAPDDNPPEPGRREGKSSGCNSFPLRMGFVLTLYSFQRKKRR
jgi:hypothetical protein